VITPTFLAQQERQRADNKTKKAFLSAVAGWREGFLVVVKSNVQEEF
jgi:hypothetical protein